MLGVVPAAQCGVRFAVGGQLLHSPLVPTLVSPAQSGLGEEQLREGMKGVL